MEQQENTSTRKRKPESPVWGGEQALEVPIQQGGQAVGPQYKHGTKLSFFAEPPPVGLLCQVPGCCKSLKGLKNYYQKYKICPEHLELPFMVVEGQAIRFCQQCGRYQLLSEFDGTRRTCRVKLEQHNRRRRGYDFAPVATESEAKEQGQTSPNAAANGQGPAQSTGAAAAAGGALPQPLGQHPPSITTRTRAKMASGAAGSGSKERRSSSPEGRGAGSSFTRSRSFELEVAAQLANLNTPLGNSPAPAPQQQQQPVIHPAPVAVGDGGLLHLGLVPNTHQQQQQQHQGGFAPLPVAPGYDPSKVYVIERLPPAPDTEPRDDDDDEDNDGDGSSSGGVATSIGKAASGVTKRRKMVYPTTAQTELQQQQQQQQQAMVGGLLLQPVPRTGGLQPAPLNAASVAAAAGGGGLSFFRQGQEGLQGCQGLTLPEGVEVPQPLRLTSSASTATALPGGLFIPPVDSTLINRTNGIHAALLAAGYDTILSPSSVSQLHAHAMALAEAEQAQRTAAVAAAAAAAAAAAKKTAPTLMPPAALLPAAQLAAAAAALTSAAPAGPAGVQGGKDKSGGSGVEISQDSLAQIQNAALHLLQMISQAVDKKP